MNIDAAIAGVIYGSLIGVVSWLITTLLKRLSWPVWILNTLLITFVSLLLFVIETPFQIAAGIEWLEITNPGHFGSNFIFVFLVTVVIWIVVVAINLARQVNARKDLHNDADIATK